MPSNTQSLKMTRFDLMMLDRAKKGDISTDCRTTSSVALQKHDCAQISKLQRETEARRRQQERLQATRQEKIQQDIARGAQREKARLERQAKSQAKSQAKIQLPPQCPTKRVSENIGKVALKLTSKIDDDDIASTAASSI